jgi:ADP-ribose pyrophosphatase YjhB (NUDIX family)
MRTPDLISGYEFRGHVDVEWYDVCEKEDIPDLQWNQVYIVGNYKGKVPVVIYPNAQDNLPGGGVESGELLEQTIVREVKEETNLHVVSWKPLGYQVCTRRDTGEVSYQFRAYARLEKLGEFTNDPGGSVIGHKFIEPENLNDSINYGAIGERLIAMSRQYFIDES